MSHGHQPALIPVQMAMSPGHLLPLSPRIPGSTGTVPPSSAQAPSVGPAQLSTPESPGFSLKAGIKHQPGILCQLR